MAVDRGTIDAQLREIGEGERWWERREFRDLPYVLHPDERILGLVDGQLIGGRRPRLPGGARWLIVATSLRLLCLKQERFARRQVEIAAGQVTRIHQRNRLRSCQITLESPLQRIRIRISKADAFRFSAALAPLLPQTAVERARSPLDEWAWIPGVTMVSALPGVTEIASRFAVLTSPPPPSATLDQIERLEATVERLQEDVERLQQQVAFLEELLQKRVTAPSLPGSAAGP